MKVINFIKQKIAKDDGYMHICKYGYICVCTYNIYQNTKSTSGWGWPGVSIWGGFSFPDVNEPFAGVTPDLLSLTAFAEERNLQGIQGIGVNIVVMHVS